jgi:hypothetical protein
MIVTIFFYRRGRGGAYKQTLRIPQQCVIVLLIKVVGTEVGKGSRPFSFTGHRKNPRVFVL